MDVDHELIVITWLHEAKPSSVPTVYHREQSRTSSRPRNPLGPIEAFDGTQVVTSSQRRRVQLDGSKVADPKATLALQPGQILRLDKTRAVKIA